MELESLLSKSSIITVAHPDPDLKGFEIKLQYMSRDLLAKIRKQATTIGFDKKTRQPEETVDDELFYKLYVTEAIKGWSGLKLGHLKSLTVVDLGAQDLEAELEYSQSNAVSLVKNSTDFDNWVMAVINDVSLFNKAV